MKKKLGTLTNVNAILRLK